MPHPDAPGIDDVVSDPDGFVARDLFRRARLTSAVETDGRAASIADVSRLWADLLGRAPRPPMFRLVRDGATLPPGSYCRPAGVGHRTLDDVVQPNRVLELHEAGATVVLQGLQLTNPRLARFANNLALRLDQPVQVNAYLTPREAKGLELHFDFHDVFVVQLDGAKRWRVWEPLDRTRVPVRGGPPTPMPTFDELGAPAMDFTLSAGDCLYLPRGFPHAAEAVDVASSHLTVGVMALTWHQVLRAALDRSRAAPAVRTSIPAGALGPTQVAAPDLGPLVDELEPSAVRAWLAAEVWRRQPATRLRPLTPPDLRADRPVRVTPGPLLWLRPGGAGVELGLGDRQLTLPSEAHPFLAALLSRPATFSVSEWPGALDGASRDVVVRRLATEGVLAEAG